MIKVIGNDPKAVKTVTCRNCSSILEYVLNDMKRSSCKDISGCTEIVKYIVCPTCTHQVTV